jgi:hypothetical protein
MNRSRDHFHCCATCIHFDIKKTETGMRYLCARLGYETKPNYQFHCWNPKKNVIDLMKSKGIWKEQS